VGAHQAGVRVGVSRRAAGAIMDRRVVVAGAITPGLKLDPVTQFRPDAARLRSMNSRKTTRNMADHRDLFRSAASASIVKNRRSAVPTGRHRICLKSFGASTASPPSSDRCCADSLDAERR